MAQTVISMLRQMLTTGELKVEGGELVYQGEPVRADPPTDGKYQEDGWTAHADDYGCRRHRLIDEMIDRLERGDQFDQKVAEEAHHSFCFDVRQFQFDGDGHPIEAEDAEARDKARRAAWLSLSGYWLGVPLWDYKMDQGEGYPTPVENRSVVLTDAQQGDAIVKRWPQRYADMLEDRADALRKDAESGAPGPSPAP